MPRRARTPIEDIELERAVRPWKPGTGAGDTMRTQHFLHQPHVREVPLPEPVQVPAMVNGRPLAEWERPLYVAAMGRERRAELALFAGLIG